MKEFRWKQRFENYKKAYDQLSKAVQAFDTLDDLAKEGLVQRFEYTFELAWKTLKDYLESKGEDVKFPRDVLKKAFQLEIIENGETWLNMLEQRNLMAHTYNEAIFNQVLNQIENEYFNEIDALIKYFKSQLDE